MNDTPLGPCCICGATGYGLSMGGPTICPSCDCGSPPDVGRYQVRIAELEAERDEWIDQYNRAHKGMMVERRLAEKAEASLALASNTVTDLLAQLKVAAEERARSASRAEACLKGWELSEDALAEAAEAERLNDIMVRHAADAIIPLNEEQAEAFKAFGELVQSVQSLEARAAKAEAELDRGSRSIASYRRQVADIREQLGCPPDRHAGLFARQVRERAEKAEADADYWKEHADLSSEARLLKAEAALAEQRLEGDALDHIIRHYMVGHIWNTAWRWDEIAELRADLLASDDTELKP